MLRKAPLKSYYSRYEKMEILNSWNISFDEQFHINYGPEYCLGRSWPEFSYYENHIQLKSPTYRKVPKHHCYIFSAYEVSRSLHPLTITVVWHNWLSSLPSLEVSLSDNNEQVGKISIGWISLLSHKPIWYGFRNKWKTNLTESRGSSNCMLTNSMRLKHLDRFSTLFHKHFQLWVNDQQWRNS